MVTPIDAVSYGTGLNKAGTWRQPRCFLPAQIRGSEDPLGTARGMMLGAAIGGIMWVGAFAAGSAIFRLITKS